jgi:putative endonuclease
VSEGWESAGTDLSPKETAIMARTHERGRRGESLAARHLEDLGWTVLDRNWRAGHGEIDLVIRNGEVVAFVEVKTLARVGSSDPLEGITRRKRMEVEKTARRWILEHGGGLRYRFDAVADTFYRDGRAEVFHLPDAWWIGDP